MKASKILLLVPASTASGGITNYFQVLENSFSLPVEYMLRGARQWPYRSTFIVELVRAYKDLLKFRRRIKVGDIQLVQTSTSLGGFSVIRDGLFLYFAHRRGIKTIVFFRGWDLKFEKSMEKKYLSIFKYFFFRTDCAIVLSTTFKKKLVKWGYTNRIYIESTIIDESLLSNISKEQLLYLRKKDISCNTINILFLARVEITKGIYETIETFQLVVKNNPNLNVKLAIAGSGKELLNAKNYVKMKNIINVEFLGFIEGEEKKKTYVNADIYLFPTYSEGMPNSILEAMAFGLPIITRCEGAIPDIISNGVNGYYTDSKDPKIFAAFIQKLIDNPYIRFEMLKANFDKAVNNYTTSKVKNRIEGIYKNTLNGTTNATT